MEIIYKPYNLDGVTVIQNCENIHFVDSNLKILRTIDLDDFSFEPIDEALIYLELTAKCLHGLRKIKELNAFLESNYYKEILKSQRAIKDDEDDNPEDLINSRIEYLNLRKAI